MLRAPAAPDGSPRRISPTTATKYATRVIAAAQATAESLLVWSEPIPSQILLTLLVAEDAANCSKVTDLELPGEPSPRVVTRWVAMLERASLVERQGDLLSLSESGYKLTLAWLEAIFTAQRALD